MKITFILLALLFVGCGSNNPKYADNNNTEGVVIDPKTKLMWQDNLDAEENTLNWYDSIKYCNHLNLSNFQDWELPSRDILVTSYKSKEIFAFTSYSLYWSSSSYESNSSDAWSVLFDYGYAYSYIKTDLHYVRCVRGIR